MADLSLLDTTPLADQGSWLDVQHPVTGKPTGARILLVGEDGRIYQRAMQRQQDRFRLRREKNIGIPTEEMTEASLMFLSQITLTWENIELDGNTLRFTTDNALMLYTRLVWLREQVAQHIANRSNYLAEAKANLQNGAAGASASDSAAPTVATPSNSSADSNFVA